MFHSESSTELLRTEVGAIEAMSASDATTASVQTKMPTYTHIVPAMPPFIRLKVEVLLHCQIRFEPGRTYAYPINASQVAMTTLVTPRMLNELKFLYVISQFVH